MVEGVFHHSADTVKGKIQHRRVDQEPDVLPAPGEEGAEPIHSRSVTLSSERLRVIAKLDLIEGAEGAVTAVDYKHGPGLQVWPADRAQVVACIRSWPVKRRT